MTDTASWPVVLIELFLVDLLLGADNAVVIGLACRGLKPGEARQAAILGAAGAVALRLIMALFAFALIGTPLVNLAAAWMLTAIALNLKADTDDPDRGGRVAAPGHLVSAAVVIMAADAAMSLDNVAALASIAAGNVWLLAIGVLMSIPVLVYGALLLTEATRRAPELVTLGAVFLGWVAGGMAVADPLVAGWIAANAPALGLAAPALFAAFVLIAGGGARPPHPVSVNLAPLAGEELAARGRVLEPIPPSGRASNPPVLSETAGSAPSGEANGQSTAGAQREAPDSYAPVIAPRSDGVAPPSARVGPRQTVWTEEQLVIAGFVLIACVAGLIILVASYLDALT